MQAIEWAISKGVDVISMSLVLFTLTEDLTKAIEKATRTNDIIILADDGNNTQVVWPAKHQTVHAIAACNAFGKVTEWSTETDADYVFQGEDILTTVHGDDRSGNGRMQASGSSVATAMAAGTVSLIVACHRIHERIRGSDRRRMRTVIVPQILSNKMIEKDSKYVQPRLFFGDKPLGQPRAFASWLKDHFEKGLCRRSSSDYAANSIV
jgi:subtilisin family serine protease